MKSLPEIGDVVDDTYELISVLGTGGFGAVYRARQLNMDRDVALKLLIASGPKFNEMVKRFRREVMAIRNLTHPNTVRIFDFRDRPDGLLYYTMEALEGLTLKQELNRGGPFAPRRFKHIMLQVLKSLSEAHSYSIIHRDLKPANIMLVEMHGEEDFVKVLDFGIAKLMQDGGEEEEDVEELTSAGMLVGTLKYMAPEQIAGEKLGPHTDLYALGLIAVEMLTGDSVYSGSGRWEVLRQQVSEEPVDIPQPVLDSRLGPIIRRCLDKDRRRRYGAADEVIAHLKALDDNSLDGRPLYLADNSGGWMPRADIGPARVAQQQKQTVEYDGIPTMMLDEDALEPLDEVEATLTPIPGSGSGTDRLPPIPGAPGAASMAPTARNPAVGSPRHPVDSTGEMQAESPSGTDPNIERQYAELNANRLTTPTGEWDNQGSSGSKRMIAGAAILAVVAIGIVAGVLVLGGEDEVVDEPTEDAVAAQQDQDETTDVDDEQDTQEVEYHEILVQVEDEELTATVFVDDEEIGETPQKVKFEEEAVLRLEAEGYEPFEGRIDAETSAELVLELEPSEEEEPDAVAGRDETTTSSGGGRASSGTDRSGSGSGGGSSGGSRPDPTPEPTPTPTPTPTQPDEPDEPEVAEEEEEEDSGWIDLSGGDEEEEEEESEVPIFFQSSNSPHHHV